MTDRYYECNTCASDQCSPCPECRRCPDEHAGTCSVGDRQRWVAICTGWDTPDWMRKYIDERCVLGVPQVVYAPRPGRGV